MAAILSETVQKSKLIVIILGVNLGYHSKKLGRKTSKKFLPVIPCDVDMI
jgi:hypothetical protein